MMPRIECIDTLVFQMNPRKYLLDAYEEGRQRAYEDILKAISKNQGENLENYSNIEELKKALKILIKKK